MEKIAARRKRFMIDPRESGEECELGEEFTAGARGKATLS
jgi:hypothetical protein